MPMSELTDYLNEHRDDFERELKELLDMALSKNAGLTLELQIVQKTQQALTEGRLNAGTDGGPESPTSA